MLLSLQDWYFNVIGVTSPLARVLFWSNRGSAPSEYFTAAMLFLILVSLALAVYPWKMYITAPAKEKDRQFAIAVSTTTAALVFAVVFPMLTAHDANRNATRLQTMLADSTVRVSFKDVVSGRVVEIATLAATEERPTETIFGHALTDSTRLRYNTMTLSVPIARQASEVLEASASLADREASSRLAELATAAP